MSIKEATRKESSRGPEWDRKSLEIAYRDGAYRDAEGRLHKVCRNFTEAKRQGMEHVLPKGCARTNGESAVWACHSNSWSKYPALRLVDDNIMDLCQFCDPDRNPAMRAHWWGDPKRPVTAGWERRNGRKGTRQTLVASRLHAGSHKLLGTVALVAAGILWREHLTLWGWGAFAASLALWTELAVSIGLWGLLLVANAHLRHFASLRPWLIGPPPVGFGGLLGWMAVLLALWGACLALAHVVLSRRRRG